MLISTHISNDSVNKVSQTNSTMQNSTSENFIQFQSQNKIFNFMITLQYSLLRYISATIFDYHQVVLKQSL
jgi:hypothetical protein